LASWWKDLDPDRDVKDPDPRGQKTSIQIRNNDKKGTGTLYRVPVPVLTCTTEEN
jgi:hypothetical protein